MRLRAAHLALVMLLLSSLGASEASVLRSSRGGATAHAIAILLQQSAPARRAETALGRSLQDTAPAGAAASPAPLRAAWSMRPPAAHSAHQHAVTASLI